jgi:diguanylate cyclase
VRIKGVFTTSRYPGVMADPIPALRPGFAMRLLRRIWPAVPAAIADDMAILRYTSLKTQVPFLAITTISVILITMSMADARAHFWIRVGLPMLVVVAATGRLIWWLTQSKTVPSVEQAKRQLIKTTVIVCALALASSIWTSIGWAASNPGTRSYYPMFMALCALSAAFCMSTLRATTVALLLFGLAPTITTLLIMGDHVDRIAALIVLIAAAFMVRLTVQRHAQLVELLSLQREMRVLADTDPLTGLANRRRLLTILEHALSNGERPALILIDLDGFKPVNDQHGHATGDILLCAIADRMRDTLCQDGVLCRLGGDEFAVVHPEGDETQSRRLADRLLTALVPPFVLGDTRLSISASLGIAIADGTNQDAFALIDVADQRLYAVKNEHHLAQRPASRRRRASRG